MPKLVVHRPDPRTIDLGGRREPFAIGRLASCDLRLHAPSVARMQGRIERDGWGRRVLVDMMHTSCFLVRYAEDGRWVGRDGMRVPLEDGDRIAIGFEPPGPDDPEARGCEVLLGYEDEPEAARGEAVVEDARATFLGASLGPPPVPASLAPRLRKLDRWFYGTSRLSVRLYPDPGSLLGENGFWRERPPDERVAELREDARDLVVFGHGGHGANSYSLFYLLLEGPLAVSLAIPWGGVYMDAEASAEEVRASFARVSALIEASRAPAFRARFSRRERLTVVAHGFSGEPGWYSLGSSGARTPGSFRPRDVLAAALDALGTPG